MLFKATIVVCALYLAARKKFSVLFNLIPFVAHSGEIVICFKGRQGVREVRENSLRFAEKCQL